MELAWRGAWVVCFTKLVILLVTVGEYISILEMSSWKARMPSSAKVFFPFHSGFDFLRFSGKKGVSKAVTEPVEALDIGPRRI